MRGDFLVHTFHEFVRIHARDLSFFAGEDYGERNIISTAYERMCVVVIEEEITMEERLSDVFNKTDFRRTPYVY